MTENWTDADLDAAVAEIDTLLDADALTDDDLRRLDEITEAVEEYEGRTIPI